MNWRRLRISKIFRLLIRNNNLRLLFLFDQLSQFLSFININLISCNGYRGANRSLYKRRNIDFLATDTVHANLLALHLSRLIAKIWIERLDCFWNLLFFSFYFFFDLLFYDWPDPYFFLYLCFMLDFLSFRISKRNSTQVKRIYFL